MNARAMADTCRAEGRNYKELGDYNKALECYNTAVELEDNNPYNYYERAYCLTDKYYRESKDAKLLVQANDDFAKARELFSTWDD